MAEQQKSNTVVVKTDSNSYYGVGPDCDKALAVSYYGNNFQLGIHNPLPASQQTVGAKYDYKSGNIAHLTGKKCKALSRLIMKARDSFVSGKDFESAAVQTGSNLVEVSDGTKFGLEAGITIAIYNNVPENKISEEFNVFQFRNDDIVVNYDHTSGTYGKVSLDSDVDFFIENLKEFSKAWSLAGSHFVKKELNYNIRQAAARQLQIMDALGVKIETPRSVRTDWSSGGNSSGAVKTTMSSSDLISELEGLGD